MTWTFSPLEETKYLFRVGIWVWEAGLPPNTKPPTTTHYMLRLVGLGITGSLSVSGRTLVGGGTDGREETRCLTPRRQGMGVFCPPQSRVSHPDPALPRGCSEARGGKAGATGLGAPPPWAG